MNMRSMWIWCVGVMAGSTVFVAHGGEMAGGPSGKTSLLRFVVQTRDEQTLVGTFSTAEFKVKTAFGDVQIPLEKVTVVYFRDAEPAKLQVEIVSGKSVIQGQLIQQEAVLNTAYGPLRIPLASMVSVKAVGVGKEDPLSGTIKNGDFSKGLEGWSVVSVANGRFPGWPKVFVYDHGRTGRKFVCLDVPGGADAYIEQLVTVPNRAGIRLRINSWGQLDPVDASVIVVEANGKEHQVDTFDSLPKVQKGGQEPESKSYDLTAFRGQKVSLRFRATSLSEWEDGVKWYLGEVGFIEGERSKEVQLRDGE